jgi:hypothetical protein
MEAVSISEMPVNYYETARYNISEGRHLQILMYLRLFLTGLMNVPSTSRHHENQQSHIRI